MTFLLGLLFSILALFGWGVGDFLIQKAARRFGIWTSAFCVGMFGFAVLTPFVLHDLSTLSLYGYELLLVVGIASMISAALNFEALRRGKYSVIQPIIGLELPLVVLLSVAFAGERLSTGQFSLIFLVFLGIAMLASSGELKQGKVFEKGAVFGLLGALGIAAVTFLVGYASRTDSPAVIVWAAHGGVALSSALVLSVRGELDEIRRAIRLAPWLLLFLGILDTLAWFTFGMATTLIPISIATGVSENFITHSVILGVVLNREKLKEKQWYGAAIAVAGMVLLALVSGPALG